MKGEIKELKKEVDKLSSIATALLQHINTNRNYIDKQAAYYNNLEARVSILSQLLPPEMLDDVLKLEQQAREMFK